MKTIVTGSTSLTSMDNDIVKKAIEEAINESGFDVSEIVVGDEMEGVSYLADQLSNDLELDSTIFESMDASYKEGTLISKQIRNVEMAEYGDQVIALWDGKSQGTEHMITIAKQKGMNVHIVYTVDFF